MNQYHNHNNCRLSYGILCIRNNIASSSLVDKIQNKTRLTNDDIANLDILMIRGKHSYNYIEFLMGKYDLNNVEYILSLLSEITENEKRILLSGTPFLQLWKKLWNISPSSEISNYVTEYDNAKNKYEQIVTGYQSRLNGKNIYVRLHSLLDTTFQHMREPIWGFPKGKRNSREESDINCALREFHEETNIELADIRILPINPIQEYYKASNKKFYCNIYYIAEYIGNPGRELTISETNVHQSQEIGGLQWVSWYDSYHLIQNNYLFRKNILYQLEFILKNLH